MIVYHNINLLCWPLLLVVSIIDLFLLLAGIRLLLETFHSTKAQKLCSQIKPLIDPVPQHLGSLILHCSGPVISSRWCWIITIAVALLMRYLILKLIM